MKWKIRKKKNIHIYHLSFEYKALAYNLYTLKANEAFHMYKMEIQLIECE